MIFYEKVYQAVDELVPAFPSIKVRDVIETYTSNNEDFSVFLVLEEREEYVVLYNIYSIEGGIQGELGLFVFEKRKIYLSVNNDYPSDFYLDSVRDIFTSTQFSKWNIKITDGVPSHSSTGYEEALNRHE